MKVVRGSEIEYVPAAHEDPTKPGVLKRVLATKQELAAGQVPMLNWSLLKVGHSFQRHYHENMQEVFVILSGHVEMEIESENIALNPGDAVLVDPKEVHTMSNHSDTDAEYLVFGIAVSEGGQTVIVED